MCVGVGMHACLLLIRVWHGACVYLNFEIYRDYDKLSRHACIPTTSVAPKIMTAIVEWVLRQDPIIAAATSSYIDDIFVEECKVSADKVVTQLQLWG